MTALSMADVLIGRIREATDSYGRVDAADVERVIRAYFDEVMHLPKPPGALGFDRGRGAGRP